MKKLFNADLVTLRSLFTNEYNANDRAKNYYIPLYQREYNWERKHIIKLFDDLNDLAIKGFQPYFLGGLVFSRQSMEGDERTNMSMEVIDGQQRLTTLSIMLALILQSLKFENRNFEGKEDFISNLVEELTSYTLTKRFDSEYKVSKVLKVERSDQLQKLYEKVIVNLVNKKIKYKDYDYLVNDDKKFFNNLRALHSKIKGLKENEIIHFTLQLLDHTEIVVTKTDSFETGYLVFEKLNDSGKGLSAHDLLKNYLFSIRKDDDDNDIIKEKWEYLLEIIDNIDPKVSPKDFLEFYLIIIGTTYKTATTTDIFAGYKDYFVNNENTTNIMVLDEMIKMAAKLKELKESVYATQILNKIGFKFGFLIFLSFYNRYENDYKKLELRIVNLVVRLGYIYIITNDLKEIKKEITAITKKVSSINYMSYQAAIIDAENYINNLIINKRIDFESAISNENRYRREHFTMILFELINTHSGLETFNEELILERIMPEDIKKSNYSFENIDEDTLLKYSNLVGNLAVYNIHQQSLSLDFNERMDELIDINHIIINESLNINSTITNNKFKNKLEISNNKQWGKESISNRTKVITEIAIDLFINNKIDVELAFPSQSNNE